MPDIHGFDHLGRGCTVACIYCDTRGPVYELTEKKRAQHARRHERERTASTSQSVHERQLILAGDPLDEGA